MFPKMNNEKNLLHLNLLALKWNFRYFCLNAIPLNWHSKRILDTLLQIFLEFRPSQHHFPREANILCGSLTECEPSFVSKNEDVNYCVRIFYFNLNLKKKKPPTLFLAYKGANLFLPTFPLEPTSDSLQPQTVTVACGCDNNIARFDLFEIESLSISGVAQSTCPIGFYRARDVFYNGGQRRSMNEGSTAAAMTDCHEPSKARGVL